MGIGHPISSLLVQRRHHVHDPKNHFLVDEKKTIFGGFMVFQKNTYENLKLDNL
jgi:hypothetical protein